MKNISLSPTVSFSAQEYAGQGNAILGIRDSGKSYSATFFAERLLDAKIPFIAFDPIGVWRFLKTPGTGPGYPIVVAGGDCGDLPLTPQSAPEIVRAAMHDNIPLVLDLYTMEMSKADWHRIVASCVRLLLYENKKCGLRHIFLEEAAEFCPQLIQPDQRVVYSEIEKLARMGGNASLGYTLINQRAEQLNKAVLELCDCLFLHRQKGRNSLTALSKWLHLGDSSKANDIIKRMPSLSQGECFAWLPGSESPEFVQMPKKRTFHPDRRKPELREKAERQNLDVTAFVGQLQKTLPKLAEDAKANDPKALHAEIARLRKELESKPAAKAVDENWLAGILKEHGEDSFVRGAIEGYHAGVKALGEIISKRISDLEHIPLMCPYLMPKRKGRGDTISFRPDKMVPLLPKRTISGPEFKATDPYPLPPTPKVRPATDADMSSLTGGTSIKPTQRRILTVIAQHPQGRTSRQLSVFTGLAMSGSFMNHVYALNNAGLIRKEGDLYLMTAEGTAALGPFDPLPTGRDLLDYWLREKLKPTEGRILSAVVAVGNGRISSRQIADELGLAMSGSFMNHIYHLCSLELISGKGSYTANPDLF